MKLVITTPTEIALNLEGVSYVRAEDSSGAFGIEPGHADLLSVLAVSVLIWRDGAGHEHYAALRGGVLRVRGGTVVEIATRESALSDDLKKLREVVLRQMSRNAGAEQTARFGALGLQQAAIAQIYRYLRPGEPRRQRGPVKR